MFVQTYPLRNHGQRLARQEILDRGPIFGELVYRERIARSGIYLATLLVDQDGTYGLNPLDRAVVRRITDKGLLIAGREVVTRVPSIKSSADYWPQTWWCVLVSRQLGSLPKRVSNEAKPAPAWQRAMGVA